MKNENQHSAQDVRGFLIQKFFEQFRNPPVLGDGHPEMTKVEWFLYLYPYFTSSGMKEILGLSEREFEKVRALFYRLERQKKQGKALNARNRKAEERRQFVKENADKSIHYVAKMLGIKENTVAKIRSSLGLKKNGGYCWETKIALIEAYKQMFPDITDELMARRLGCKPRTASHLRRSAGFYLRPDRRREKGVAQKHED